MPDPAPIGSITAPDVLHYRYVAALRESLRNPNITWMSLVVGCAAKKYRKPPGRGWPIDIGAQYGTVAQSALDIAGFLD